MSDADFNFQKSFFLGIPYFALYPEAGNDEYLILCNFGGRSMIGFEVMKAPPRSQEVKKPILNI